MEGLGGARVLSAPSRGAGLKVWGHLLVQPQVIDRNSEDMPRAVLPAGIPPMTGAHSPPGRGVLLRGLEGKRVPPEIVSAQAFSLAFDDNLPAVSRL